MIEKKVSATVLLELQKLLGESSYTQTANKIGCSADVLKNVCNNKCGISNNLAKLLEKSTGIYANWWRTGEGLKYKKENLKLPRLQALTKDNLFNDFHIKINELQENAGYMSRKMAQLICNGDEVRYAKLSSGEEKPTPEEFFNVILNFSISADELIFNAYSELIG